ncbi:MAG: VCBS repeat-containing protein [Fibrobacteria bacterium]|nr:VCBS repeat-containing protein [Fibrobacteria bacterium]
MSDRGIPMPKSFFFIKKRASLLVFTLLLLISPSIYANFVDMALSAGITDFAASTSAAWGDYDNDGDLDLYITNAGSTDKLYQQQTGQIFTDVTTTAGLGNSGVSYEAAWCDYDNDGDLDLFVADSLNSAFYINQGNGTFSNGTSTAGINHSGVSKAVAWADFDLDGYSDLFITVNNGANVLYKNLRNGTFLDVANTSGVGYTGSSNDAAWADYDNDGDLDLFVTNFNAPNILYANNDDGSFTNVSASAHITTSGLFGGCAWGDYDNDGDLDIYVSNYLSGNILYRNNGDGTFIDVALSLGVNHGLYDLAPSWADYDNDGDLDLYLSLDADNYLYRNDGTSFTNISGTVGVADTGSGKCAAWADIDNDGDLDLFTTVFGPNKLHINELNSSESFFVRVLNEKNRPAMLGSQIKVYQAGTSTLLGLRQVNAGAGVQGAYDVHFGMNGTTSVDVTITFPGGHTLDKTMYAALGSISGEGQTISVTKPDITPPENILTLTAENIDISTIQLSWNSSMLAGSDADSVGIWYSEFKFPDSVGDGDAILFKKYDLLQTSDSFDQAENYKTFYFSLMVRDSSGNWSLPGTNSRDSIVISYVGGLALTAGNEINNLGGKVFTGQDSIVASTFHLKADDLENIIMDSIFVNVLGKNQIIEELLLIHDIDSNGAWSPHIDSILSSSNITPQIPIRINFYDQLSKNTRHAYLILANLNSNSFLPEDSLVFRLDAQNILGTGSVSGKTAFVSTAQITTPPFRGSAGQVQILEGSQNSLLNSKAYLDGRKIQIMHFTITTGPVEDISLDEITFQVEKGNGNRVNNVFVARDVNANGLWDNGDIILDSSQFTAAIPPKVVFVPNQAIITKDNSHSFLALVALKNVPFYQDNKFQIVLNPASAKASGKISNSVIPIVNDPIYSLELQGSTDTTSPAPLQNLRTVAKSGTELLLSWDPPNSSDIDSILIRYRADGLYPSHRFDGILWKTFPASNTSETVSGLVSDKIYMFSAFLKDSVGNWSQAAYIIGQTKDVLGPVVTIAPLVTAHQSPALQGTINDLTATIRLTIDGKSYTPENNGNGVWTLPENTVHTLAQGIYDVEIYAIDSLNNEGTDETTNELIIDINDYPVFTGIPDTLFAIESTPFTYKPEVTDPDSGDIVTIKTPVFPTSLSWLKWENNSLTGTPGNDDVGTTSLLLEATDGKYTSVDTVLLVVMNTNNPPRFTKRPDSLFIDQDSLFSFRLTASDIDDPEDKLQYTFKGPDWLNELNNNLVTGRPGNDDVGSYSLLIKVSDGKAADSMRVIIMVRNVNDPPEIVSTEGLDSNQLIWNEDFVYHLQFKVGDKDKGDHISLDTVLLPDFIVLENINVENDGYFVFSLLVSPLQADTGFKTCLFRFYDSNHGAISREVKFYIMETNDQPTAKAEYILRGGAIRFILDVEDEDGTLAETDFSHELISLSDGDSTMFQSKDNLGQEDSHYLYFYPLPEGSYQLSLVARDVHKLEQNEPTIIPFEVKGICVTSLDSGLWVMKSFLSPVKTSLLGPDIHIAKWLDNGPNDDLYSKYITEDNISLLQRGEGYWIQSNTHVMITSEPQQQNDDSAFHLKLVRGDLGWNQVGNPFPYHINLSHTGYIFWKWNPLTADVERTQILEPCGAYWVQVSTDTNLIIEPKPWFGNMELAKGITKTYHSPQDWQASISLNAGRYEDNANMFGFSSLLKSGAQNTTEISEPPKMGSHVSLFFTRSAGKQLVADYRPHTGDETWWEFGIKGINTGESSANLTLTGLNNLEQNGLYSYLVSQGKATKITGDEQINVPLSSQTNYYQLVVTTDNSFLEKLSSQFELAQNYPNPVKSKTLFQFHIPYSFSENGQNMSNYRFSMTLYNSQGQNLGSIYTGTINPGSHEFLWAPPATLPTGIYFYQLQAGPYISSKKMILSR